MTDLDTAIPDVPREIIEALYLVAGMHGGTLNIQKPTDMLAIGVETVPGYRYCTVARIVKVTQRPITADPLGDHRHGEQQIAFPIWLNEAGDANVTPDAVRNECDRLLRDAPWLLVTR